MCYQQRETILAKAKKNNTHLRTWPNFSCKLGRTDFIVFVLVAIFDSKFYLSDMLQILLSLFLIYYDFM